MQYKYCSAYICCHEQRLTLHDDYHVIMSCLAACYKVTGMTELLHLWQWPHFYYTCVCVCVCVCVCTRAGTCTIRGLVCSVQAQELMQKFKGETNFFYYSLLTVC